MRHLFPNMLNSGQWRWQIQGLCQGRIPSGSKFFHFYVVFDKKNCKIIGEYTHVGSWRYPQENPGSANE